MVNNQETNGLVNVTENETFGFDVEEALHLQNSDHLRMILETNLLTGLNYLSWIQAMKIALGGENEDKLH
ncbi:hypothetical protein Syun_003818 [Stephania yunnanensis]|uniref:Retrotransposon Copia-like N-terminal domain-containing protein n=1 Tax=Stephania yunnanensis TaxID=152371 RepID=A0AAP0L259_9MAGN